ncbi:flagellar basal body rod protein FlgB [Paracidovorax cattleyae]|uniref:Flagellar basal body rod protein FlgB n=1 Tax=Paracidovorax cattleyae TaxID=80868 RepID=A0A1H0U8W7_9BURK|nr:flagellar basal body rod protein FlgB [Paracidovorax cattleyae]SDP62480.1 flagellar basal-body rod protein FlgB [Paracidovorax cattleyae]
MTEGIEAITQASLSLALDAASLRQQAIARNIANASTEGYVPVDVDFAAQMEAARGQLAQGRRLDAAHLASVAEEGVRMRPMVGPDGLPARVQLDTEVARMAQNAVHYQALLKGLSRHMAILSSAVSDGKR